MGFELNSMVGLLYAERLGAVMKDVATLGRHRMYCTPRDVQSVLRAAGRNCEEESIRNSFRRTDGFCEGVFQYIWPQCKVESFDNSVFEGATVVHDMNTALPRSYAERYDVVIDGGTLEHVFHFPNAIKNALEMPKKGGYFVTIPPANNAMGHGFYQFSPELLFRVLAPENGYELCDLFVFVQRPGAAWYRVSDPATLGCRVQLRNHQRVYMLAIARRVEICEIFKTIPQQSDYSARWENSNPISRQGDYGGLKGRIVRLLRRKGFSLTRRMVMKLYLGWRPFDWRYYQRVNPMALLDPTLRLDNQAKGSSAKPGGQQSR